MALSELRRRALDGLRARHQQINPFKFIIYSEWAGADLQPTEGGGDPAPAGAGAGPVPG